jgi:hypothetical protein
LRELARAEARPEVFSLADCSFDMAFEIPSDRLEIFNHAFPKPKGTITAIIQISDVGTNDHPLCLQITGDWRGGSGMMKRYAQESVVLNLSERTFMLIQKKPLIEYAPSNMKHLVVGKSYAVQIMAFPGFAIALIPKEIKVRTHEGILYPVSHIVALDNGWYSGTLSL